MDTSSINTLTGTADKKPQAKSGAGAGNGDAFATAMGEASASDSKKADLVDRPESDKAKDDKAVADKKQDQAAQSKDAAKAADPHHNKIDGRVSEYLKTVTNKDPATLSLAEKQAFRLGEFSTQKQGVGGMAQMFAQQGIDLSGFSPQQIKSMMSRMDTKEMGQVLSQMKSDPSKFDESTLKAMKEQLTAATAQQPKDAPAFNLDGLLAAGGTKEAGEAARAEQRRQVLDQVLSHIEVQNVANQTEMNLRLNPEYLGEMKISLVHDDEGGIRATFQTTSKATREVLTDNKTTLLDEARNKGVRIGAMNVELVDEIES